MTIAAIPASKFVSSLPSVLSASGAELSMDSVWLDEDSSIPIGTVQGFANTAAVQAWYGPSSNQAALAAIYFAGYTDATQIPSELYFFQYNTTAVAGYMRGGSVAGITLAQIQALSGTITVVIDGVSHVSAAINLASATSFTSAAALIQTGPSDRHADDDCDGRLRYAAHRLQDHQLDDRQLIERRIRHRLLALARAQPAGRAGRRAVGGRGNPDPDRGDGCDHRGNAELVQFHIDL